MSAATGASLGILERLLVAVIWLYRLTLSPLLGGHCRFWPSCSRYAEEAVRSHGAWRGGILAARRLGRCHPWHEGGVDPVPTISSVRSPGRPAEGRLPSSLSRST